MPQPDSVQEKNRRATPGLSVRCARVWQRLLRLKEGPDVRSGSCLSCRIGLRFTAALSLLATLPLWAQFTTPPKRKACVGGPTPNKVCQNNGDCGAAGQCKAILHDDRCPPNQGNHIKVEPDPTLGDKDKNGDGDLDYFQGEWKFVDGDTDVVVRQWCMNGGPPAPPPHAAVHDFYAFEITTSTGNTETTRIAPSQDTMT